MLSHTGAPLNHSPLAIQLFRSDEDISEDLSFHSQFTQVLLRMLSHSSHLIQPGAISLFKQSFNHSLEWALTHRSFPRILPDSSNFSGVILKFFFKFDIRMISISQMFFPKSFHILYIVGSTFPILIRECLNNSWWCFSSSFSTCEDRRRVF